MSHTEKRPSRSKRGGKKSRRRHSTDRPAKTVQSELADDSPARSLSSSSSSSDESRAEPPPPPPTITVSRPDTDPSSPAIGTSKSGALLNKPTADSRPELTRYRSITSMRLFKSTGKSPPAAAGSFLSASTSSASDRAASSRAAADVSPLFDQPPPVDEFVEEFFRCSRPEQEALLRSLHWSLTDAAVHHPHAAALALTTRALSPRGGAEDTAARLLSRDGDDDALRIPQRLHDVLTAPASYHAFKLSLQRMSADENLDFFEAALAYRQKRLVSYQQCAELARRIAQQFVGDAAASPVNLDAGVVARIGEQLAQQLLPVGLFDEAIEAVALSLAEDCLRKHDASMIETRKKADELRAQLRQMKQSRRRKFAEHLAAAGSSLAASLKLFNIATELVHGPDEDTARCARQLAKRLQADELGSQLVVPRAVYQQVVQAVERADFNKAAYEPLELYLAGRVLHPELVKFQQLGRGSKSAIVKPSEDKPPTRSSKSAIVKPSETIGAFGLPVRTSLPEQKRPDVQ